MTISLRNETTEAVINCAAPGCDSPITPTGTGRPARYCSPACRARAHRRRHISVPAVAEVTTGSASSRGRHPDRAWLVQLRRGNQLAVVTIGLHRTAADRLAEQINQLLNDPAI